MKTEVTPSRGDIWLVRFDPTTGDEIRKTRPAIVISSDSISALRLKIVVPLINWQKWRATVPWFTRFTPTEKNGLSKESAADGSQVKSVSLNRFVRKLGVTSKNQLVEVVESVMLCIDA